VADLSRWVTSPPVDDPEARRVGESLQLLALIFVAIASAWSLLALVFFVDAGPILPGALVAVGVLAAAGWLGRTGWVRLGAWLFVGQLFAVTVLGLVAEAGISGPAASNFVIAVIAAGLLLPRRAAVGVALGALVVLGVMTGVEAQGLLEPSVVTPLARIWLAEATMVAGALGIVLLTVNRLVAAHRARGAEEARFQALAERAPELVAEIGEDGRFVYANSAHRSQLGWPPEEVVGRRPSEFVPPEDRDRPRRVETLGVGEHLRDTWRLLRVDGSAPWYEFDATRYVGPDGVERTLALGRDVTERLELEERLRRAEKMEALGQLAGGVAHDFNNYLTVILGSAELLAESPPPGLDRDALEDLRVAARRSADLTRQLMAFSRHRLNHPRLVDLRGVVRRGQGLLRRLLPENIEVEVRTGDEPVWVRADPAQIEQVLLNLAVNARDAMPDGGRLRVETRVESVDDARAAALPGLAPGSYGALRVEDTGRGMEPEVMRRAFEPLFTTKPGGGGTGLGLATVEAIVRESGGVVDVQSDPGAGSAFRVLLPTASAETGDEVAEADAEEAVDATGHETVLLVEDDSMVRAFARRSLESRGYRVREAPDAETASAILEASPPPELIVTDVMLPGASGLELAKRVEALGDPPRVLLMSGYSQRSLAEHGLDVASPVLHKPFTARDLVVRVREVLDRPR